MAVSYGVGAALTLDEFALWLNLEPDAYWSREGRISIDAVILFGGILAVGAWGAPFFRGLQPMWSKRRLFGQGLGRGVRSSIRHVRLLRPRKVRRSPPQYRSVITRRFSFIDGVSSPESCDHSSATRRKRLMVSKLARPALASRTSSP